MLKDHYDRIIVTSLVVVIACTVILLASATPERGGHAVAAVNRQMEREMLYQARVAFIERHYSPVEVLRDNGALQEALLKLEELRRALPGEAHTEMLSGDILLRMGQFDRSLTKLAEAVRGNADYVDNASPLSQRPLIEAAVNEGLPMVRDRLRAHPENRSLEKVVKDGYYLQSRLAGGCE